MKKKIILNNQPLEIEYEKLSDLEYDLGSKHFEIVEKTSNELLLKQGAELIRVSYVYDPKHEEFHVCGPNFEYSFRKATHKRADSSASEGSLNAPMPGKIFKILFKDGAAVKKGETILILEAMKMEHSIKAPADGLIKKIYFKEGQQVEANAKLADLD
jgi:biotin carboxyl carrier protein